MSKLTDTQLLILSAASQRPDRRVLPLPDRLRGGAAKKVIGALIAKGLVAEVEAGRGDPIWRETGDGPGLTLVATEAADAALGLEPESVADAAPAEPAEPRARKTREGSKQAQLIAMLEADGGASIDEIVAATGWQPHYADVRIMPM